MNTHGHAHPKIAEAIAEKSWFDQVILADFSHYTCGATLCCLLESVLPGDLNHVFLDNGSTSVEVALKMAPQAQHTHGGGGDISPPEGAYHVTAVAREGRAGSSTSLSEFVIDRRAAWHHASAFESTAR